MIVKEKGKYHLYSRDGSRHLGGPYDTRDEVIKRERQVQYYKRVKTASFNDEITKLAVQIDFSGHFWERSFARPRVKRDHAYAEGLIESIGTTDAFIEDIDALKYILNNPKNKRYVYQESPSKAKFVLGIKEDPATGKHKFVTVTGLNPEYTANLEDITPVLTHLAQTAPGI